MYRGTFAIVDVGAIRKNVAAIKTLLTDDTRLMVTVKANGYGHGALQTARAAIAGGATDFGVASVEEGVCLRKAGIQEPILVLGVTSRPGAQAAAAAGLAVTVTEIWDDLPDGYFHPPLAVHVKSDTGMGRLGLRNGNDLVRLVQWVSARSDMRWQGVFTHLACADGEDYTHVDGQIEKFGAVIDQLRTENLDPPLIHASNSAGTLRNRNWHYGMVRVGISAYGYPPADNFLVPVTLTPALHLYSFITRVETLAPGDTVGYGATFVAQRATRVATLPIGYADGYFRRFSNRAYVIVRGEKAPVIGNVCMDQLMVDVTDLANVQVGDCATLYGRQASADWQASKVLPLPEDDQVRWLSATWSAARTGAVLSLDTLAAVGSTISYEIMCALASRVPRIYVDSFGENFDRANSSSV